MDSKVLLQIVHKAIEEEFGGKKIDKEGYYLLYPALKEKRAVFVTINKRDSLRGCIGSLIAYRPLLEDLIENAKSAAFKDPRFPPLSKEEYESGDLEIEISILTPPKELNYSDIDDLKTKIKPNVHGVILTIQNYRATFLPQVWEQLPTFDAFFAHLCQKAGLTPDCLKYHPKIEVYEAIKIKEEK